MLAACSVLFVSTGFAETPAEKGLKIAQAADAANAGFAAETSEMKMTLINAHGDKTERRMSSKVLEGTDDGDKSIITFLWPADVKDTRMLTWTHKKENDDQWLTCPRSNGKADQLAVSQAPSWAVSLPTRTSAVRGRKVYVCVLARRGPEQPQDPGAATHADR